MMKVENFAIKSMKNCLLYNMDNTLKGILQYGDGINITNSSSDVELRSGQGNTVLYSMASEFASEFSGTFVSSMDLLTSLLGQTATPTEKDVIFTETKDYPVSNKTVTLDNTPATGGKMNVFALDGNGLRTEMVLGNGTDANTYSISGKVITVPSGVATIKVVYDYNATGIEIKKEAKDTTTYKFVADCVFVDLASNVEHVAQIRINKFKLSPNFDIKASNTEFAKWELKAKCLLDAATNSNWIVAVKS